MKLNAFFSVLACGMLFFSCQKNETVETAINPLTLNLLTEDAQITQSIDQIMIYVDYYSAMDEAIGLKSATIESSCAIVTRTSIVGNRYPVTLTIDFGTACVAANGKTKSGKVIVVKSAPWKVAGASRSVTFENHYVDGVKVEGTQTATNAGVVGGKQTFNWTGAITLTKADNSSVTRNETRTREYIAGFDTPGVSADDVIQFSGSSTVTRSDNSTYSRTITVPLVKKGNCDYITAGIVEISKSGTEKYTIDYGTGDCDNKATVSRGTNSKEIELKK